MPGAVDVRICLVGHFTDRPDEGVRNIANSLSRELSKRHEVITVSINSPLSGRRIRAFRPHIIHYVLCPTLSGLAMAKLLALFYPAAKTLVSAPQPAPLRGGKWMSLFRPDLVLVQSIAGEKMFQDLGYRTRFLPNGVNTEKFVPVSADARRKLRQKYGIREDQFVILHVASLKRGRNLEILKKLQSESRNQVLIVGRVGEHRDESLRNELEAAGCIVRTDYLPDIEEIYALSDCYVFPTVDRQYCIEMPLSVLEAMSCNLPVITMPFGALPRVFKDGDGFKFVRTEPDFFDAVTVIKKENIPIRTREKVSLYSWEKVVKQLEEFYSTVSTSS